MARGSLAKVRWRNDRIRKKRERDRRRRTAPRTTLPGTGADTADSGRS